MNNEQRKTALVTGAGRGIGSAIAQALAAEGYLVYINYAGNEEAARRTEQAILEQGHDCRLIRADLRQPDCAEQLAQAVPEVDILVLNASIQYRHLWNEITLQEFEEQVNCNFRSALLLIQKYAPGMLSRHWGRIITVGSVQERKPNREMLVYSSLKSALTGMACSLAAEFADSGVTVNSVAPGVIATDRNRDVMNDPKRYADVCRKIPMGYWGEPKDCAGIVSFLCSEKASYITGQNIFVDGGMGL